GLAIAAGQTVETVAVADPTEAIGVNTRADLAMTLADLGARQRRAVYRPVDLGRERLAARARMLPRPEALLQAQTQRLDDLAERLRRGLGERSAKGRERLAGVAARLSPSLLTRSTAEAARRLGGTRLTPSLVERPIRQGTDRLAALTRVMSQLHPEKPLERGYAIIRDAGGKALTTRAEAVREAALVLQFRDGRLDAVPSGAATPPTPRPAPKPRPAAPLKQDDLFS
ncbi:MAG: exodeoxyribonuclease VII large subunit, partial [Erythrobacter sp.]|nr:exodeoxyribonuclease VII large subunit [Erythrobacter sp.]